MQPGKNFHYQANARVTIVIENQTLTFAVMQVLIYGMGLALY